VFLIPLWTSIYCITFLRRQIKSYITVEVIVLFALLFVGSLAKSAFDRVYFDADNTDFVGLFTMSIWWTAFFYGIERFIIISKNLVALKLQETVAKIEAKRYQINPHMLFNCINSISSLIYTKPDKADQMLHDLADLLRYTLSMSQKARVPLYEELEILEKYIELERVRFGERLQYTISTSEDCLNISVPPLILQPLVENAIKHNGSKAQLHINVTCSIENGRVHLVVSDNGKGFHSEPKERKNESGGVGLANIKAQVAQLRGGYVSFSNHSKVLGDGACITMSFAIV
jgi:sensor histidine kinase YesM